MKKLAVFVAFFAIAGGLTALPKGLNKNEYYDIVNNFRTQVDYILPNGGDIAFYHVISPYVMYNDFRDMVTARDVINALYKSGTPQQMYAMLYWLDARIGKDDHGHAYNFRMFVEQRYGSKLITDLNPETSCISYGTKQDPLQGFSMVRMSGVCVE